MKGKTNVGELQPPQHGEKGTPLLLMNLPVAAFEEAQRIAQGGKPGVSTVRVPPAHTPTLPPTCHHSEVEFAFVCKKCRLAYAREASLLAHQRSVCYPGQLADARGAIRLLSTHYECRSCNPPKLCSSAQEFFRHDAEVHGKTLPFKPDSGLTHEMENVVNQITALAAQVAQETGPDSNANFSMKNKELFVEGKLSRMQAPLPIHSSGH